MLRVGLVLLLAVACGSTVLPDTPAPQATPTPNIPLTVEAVVNLRLSEISTVTPAPTPTIVPSATLVSTPTPVPTPTALPQATSTPRPTPTATFAEVTAGVRNAIVQIETPLGTGSGTLINSEGDILTNYHVIKGYTNVIVRINDAITVVGFDELIDIAIVNVGYRPLTFIPLSSRRPEIGEELITIGFPRVDLVGLQGGSTLTRGIVSAIRQIDGQTFIQTDAAINSGNSGGAAIDRDGNFIGIPTAKFAEADNFGLLIPGFDISSLIQQLQGGYRYALPPPTPLPTATPRPTPTPVPSCLPIDGPYMSGAVRNPTYGYQVVIPFAWSLNSQDDDFWSLSSFDGLTVYAITGWSWLGNLRQSSLESFHISHGEAALMEAMTTVTPDGTALPSQFVYIRGVPTFTTGFTTSTMTGGVRSFLVECYGVSATYIIQWASDSRQQILDWGTIEDSLFGSIN